MSGKNVAPGNKVDSLWLEAHPGKAFAYAEDHLALSDEAVKAWAAKRGYLAAYVDSFRDVIRDLKRIDAVSENLQLAYREYFRSRSCDAERWRQRLTQREVGARLVEDLGDVEAYGSMAKEAVQEIEERILRSIETYVSLAAAFGQAADLSGALAFLAGEARTAASHERQQIDDLAALSVATTTDTRKGPGGIGVVIPSVIVTDCSDRQKAMVGRRMGGSPSSACAVEIAPDPRVISDVIDWSPAYDAGLKAGDLILRIDGKDTSAMKRGEILDNLRGACSEKVELTLRRGDQEFSRRVPRELPNIPTKLFDARTGLLATRDLD